MAKQLAGNPPTAEIEDLIGELEALLLKMPSNERALEILEEIRRRTTYPKPA